MLLGVIELATALDEAALRLASSNWQSRLFTRSRVLRGSQVTTSVDDLWRGNTAILLRCVRWNASWLRQAHLLMWILCRKQLRHLLFVGDDSIRCACTSSSAIKRILAAWLPGALARLRWRTCCASWLPRDWLASRLGILESYLS